jgi:hypothetical protein
LSQIVLGLSIEIVGFPGFGLTVTATFVETEHPFNVTTKVYSPALANVALATLITL